MNLKTKNLALLVFLILSLCFARPTHAQFWKKLKQKVENKIDQKADKAIDGILNGKKEKQKEEVNTSASKLNKEEDFGDATINHSHTYGSLQINHLTRTTVHKKGNQFTIKGHWWSSEADVFDGYSITLKNTSLDDLTNGKTFQIPSEASFYIGYDPLLGDRVNRKKNWSGSVDNNLKTGTITLKFVKDKSVYVSFAANGTLSKYIETNSQQDEGYYDNKPISIDGKFSTNQPEFTISKPDVIETKEKDSNGALTNSDKSYLKDKLSPTVNIPNSFTFNKSIDIEFKDNRGEIYPIEILLGSYPDIWGISVTTKEMGKNGKVVMVMTPKSSTAFMDVAGMKMKRSTSLEQIGSQFNMTNQLPEDEDFEYKKTGNTKTILGYTCEEYKVDYNYTNSKGSASFWVSKDFPIQNKELPMLGMKMNNPHFSGFVLEFNTTHNEESYSMKVIEVSDKNLLINTSDFKKMGF